MFDNTLQNSGSERNQKEIRPQLETNKMKHIIPKLMGFRENSTKRDVYRDNRLHQMNSITLYVKELEKEEQPKPKGRKRNF